MPTKIYSQTNIVSMSEGYISGPAGSITPILNNTDNAIFSISGSQSNPTGGVINSIFSYQRLVTLDYTDITFPIPEDALINKIVIRVPASNTLNASAAGVGAFYDIEVLTSPYFYDAGATPLPFVVSGNPVNLTFSYSLTGSSADYVFFDDGIDPLTRDQLIAGYSNFIFPIQFQGTASGLTSSSLNYVFAYTTGWQVAITYTQPFVYEVDRTVAVKPGDTVRITSHGNPDFTELLTLEMGGIPVVTIITQTPTLLEFIIPDFGTPTTVEIIITSTQFGGSVTLIKLPTIYLIDAPGIYRIVPGQKHDILYDIANGGTPVSVNIPDPTFRTGYIGG